MTRFVVFLLLISLPAAAQQRQLPGRFSFDGNNIPFATMVDTIRRGAGLDPVFPHYKSYWIGQARRVSMHVKNITYEEAFIRLFHNQQLDYTIDSPSLVIKPKKVRATILHANGDAAEGVYITVNGVVMEISDSTGEFSFHSEDTVLLLQLSGKHIRDTSYTVRHRGQHTIIVQPRPEDMPTVTVLADGYQKIPPERATGSYGHLKKESLDQRVSTDIMDRIIGNISSLYTNPNARQTANESSFNIRSLATFDASRAPLIVIDDVPYYGFDNTMIAINPSNVESITVLKDAAAASIWGIKAANGVIVITTKKGEGSPPHLSFSSAVTVSQKPDAFSFPHMSSADFVDIQLELYRRGYYALLESFSPAFPLSPVAEIIKQRENGILTDMDTSTLMTNLRSQDIRHSVNKHAYSRSVNQQYTLSLGAAGKKMDYYFDAGYNTNRELLQDSYNNRTSFFLNSNYRPFNKLSINYTAYFQSLQSKTGTIIPFTRFPYQQWDDAYGNAVPVDFTLRQAYLDTLPGSFYRNWSYLPLDELKYTKEYTRSITSRLTGSIKYIISKAITAGIEPSYSYNTFHREKLFDQRAYEVRNLQNNFMNTGVTPFTTPIPDGSLQDYADYDLKTFFIRIRADYTKTFRGGHTIKVLGAFESTNNRYTGHTGRIYGYNPVTGSGQPVDFTKPFKQFMNPFIEEYIPGRPVYTSIHDHYLSYLANASWGWSNYIVTASIRKDRASIQGVEAAGKEDPFWSVGARWIIDKEKFYHLTDQLPKLSLRISYGTNGNLHRGIRARNNFIDQLSPGISPAGSITPDNPGLSWEKATQFNAGLDIKLKNDIITGSIDFYTKRSDGVVGNTLFNTVTGNTEFVSKNGKLKGHGWDIMLTSKNIDVKGGLNWQSTLLFSLARNTVIRMNSDPIPGWMLSDPQFANAVPGKPINSLYSFKWAGLSHEQGDPQGYLNGQVSSDYEAIINNADSSTLIYHGPTRPTATATLRNTFTWKNLQLTIACIGNFGYFVRVPSIGYNNIGIDNWGHADFSHRWQKPGDELRTSVPSVVYDLIYGRDILYNNSDITVARGDHIRLKDIYLSYEFKRQPNKNLPFRSLLLYAYAGNLGIIWKSTSKPVDPDYLNVLPERASFSIGFKAGF